MMSVESDDARSEFRGIGTGEPYPANAADGAHRAQEVGEIVGAIVVAVDRLAEQRYLGAPLLHQCRDLADHLR